LVGSDTLPDEQRLILETARLLREGFLQQNSFDPVDAYSPVEKQIRMLGLILNFHRRAQRIIKQGALISAIHDLPVVNTLIRMKTLVENDQLEKFEEIQKDIDQQMEKLEAEYV
jgi:V/A-type H+-transporting ATPase subunit A